MLEKYGQVVENALLPSGRTPISEEDTRKKDN